MKWKSVWIAGSLVTGLLMCAAQAGASTLTTTCLQSSYPAGCTTLPAGSAGYWESSTFISSTATDWNLTPGNNTYTGNPSLPVTAGGQQFDITGFCNGTCNGQPANVTYAVNGTNSGYVYVDASRAGSYLEVTMPAAGENAFWIGLGINGGSGSLTLTLSDGEVFSNLTSAGFGVALSSPISWFQLSASSGEAEITDFKFAASALPQGGGNPSPAPETATILLVSGGALILFGARRCFRRQA